MTHNQPCNIYIASCTELGGIYHYVLNSDGSMEFVNKTELDRPMYMAIENNKMHVLLREPFIDNDESGLITYDIDELGYLKKPSKILSTKGQVACHLTVKDGKVYCANYISGSVIKMPDTVVIHKGKGIHPLRQTSPHTHFVGFTPDNKYLLVTDLGLDKVFIYTPDMILFDEINVPAGHGARHFVFSVDGNFMFVANELESTVSSFSYSEGKFTYIETISCLPENNQKDSTASAIRYENDKIFVSNRGHNSISVIKHDSGKMKLLTTLDCGGNFPRDFDIIGNFIISTNEKSNSVTVIDRTSLKIVFEVTDIGSPIAVICK